MIWEVKINAVTGFEYGNTYCFVMKHLSLPGAFESMTRKQLDDLIKLHESHRDFAKAYLDNHYHDLEAQDKETEWLNRYIFHKRVVEQLKREKAEDE